MRDPGCGPAPAGCRHAHRPPRAGTAHSPGRSSMKSGPSSAPIGGMGQAGEPRRRRVRSTASWAPPPAAKRSAGPVKSGCWRVDGRSFTPSAGWNAGSSRTGSPACAQQLFRGRARCDDGLGDHYLAMRGLRWRRWQMPALWRDAAREGRGGSRFSRTMTRPALPSSAAGRAGTCESRKRRVRLLGGVRNRLRSGRA
jgi:hypothetical protein